MSLSNILLGMLEQPASGYDLKNRFEEQQGHYWSANLAQIYPTLDRMERKGLLASETQPSRQGPPRRVYTRTESGRQALLDWLQGGPELKTERLSWLAQVGFLAALDPREQVTFLNSLRAAFQAHRDELATIEADWRREDSRFPDQLPPEELFPHFTLRLGLAKYETIVTWCEECLARLGHPHRDPGENA